MGKVLERAAVDYRSPELSIDSEDAWGVVYDGLPVDEYKAIKLVYHDGLTQCEAADILGITQQAVCARLDSALGKLRQRPLLIRTLKFIVGDLNRYSKPEFIKPAKAVEQFRVDMGHIDTLSEFRGYFGKWDIGQKRMAVADIAADNARRVEVAKERSDAELYFSSILIDQLLTELSETRQELYALEESINEDVDEDEAGDYDECDDDDDDWDNHDLEDE